MLALVMTCAIAGCSSSSKNDADVTITIGTSPDYAPYESLNKKGEIVGFDVDMAKLFEGYLSDMAGKTDVYKRQISCYSIKRNVGTI